MFRLRVAGGAISSDWVRARYDRAGAVHAVVDNEDWRGALEMGTAVTIDFRIDEEDMVNLYDVLHRLIDGRGALTEAEQAQMHDAVTAHATGAEDSEEVRQRREAEAAQGLADKFQGVSDQELLERAADGDAEANAERNRRKVLGSDKSNANSKAKEDKAPATA